MSAVIYGCCSRVCVATHARARLRPGCALMALQFPLEEIGLLNVRLPQCAIDIICSFADSALSSKHKPAPIWQKFIVYEYVFESHLAERADIWCFRWGECDGNPDAQCELCGVWCDHTAVSWIRKLDDDTSDGASDMLEHVSANSWPATTFQLILDLVKKWWLAAFAACKVNGQFAIAYPMPSPDSERFWWTGQGARTYLMSYQLEPVSYTHLTLPTKA